NFDFSSIEHGAITSFSLTLNFAGTGNSFENWAMRPASSGLVGSSRTQSLTKTTAAFSQTFIIDNVSNPDVFNTIVSNNNFYLWFASNGLGQQNFTLNSATLDVKGESVPEPASLALFGIAALGFSAARRRVSTAA
ncbi:MAG: PEP-CTERM sorting domain-containing protein, partial [Cytophagaceae bacterium]